MKVIPFYKEFAIGTTYRAETNKSLVIRAIGTNSTSKVQVIVEGKVSGEFVTNFAPITYSSSNTLGPFDLRDLYIVIPKGSQFYFTGDSGKFVYAEGDLIIHEYGEDLPAEFKSRYDTQSTQYYTYISASYTSAAAASIPSGEVATVLDFTCPSGREYLLNDIIMMEASTSAGSISQDLLAHRIYINDQPLDILDSTMGPFGIATTQTPNPPRMDLNAYTLSLEENPIYLKEGTNLKIKLVNNGPSRTLASGETLRSDILLVARYKIL